MFNQFDGFRDLASLGESSCECVVEESTVCTNVVVQHVLVDGYRIRTDLGLSVCVCDTLSLMSQFKATCVLQL